MPLNQFAEFAAYKATLGLNIADGTTPQQLDFANAIARRFDQALCTNSDIIAHVVNLVDSSNPLPRTLASAHVPSGSGRGGVPPVDLLASGMPAGSTGLVLAPNDTLWLQVEVAVTIDQSVAVYALGGLLPA